MCTIPLSKDSGVAGENIATTTRPIINLHNINKSYKTAVGDYPALKDVDLKINAGEFVSIIGKSGSGKSTLLNMMTGIDRPNTGKVYVNDIAVHRLSENKMARWRGKNLGIVSILYESIIITNGEFGDMERYSTWLEAYSGHILIVEKVLCSIIDQNMLFEPTFDLKNLVSNIKEPHHFVDGRLWLDDGVNTPRATFGIIRNVFYWRRLLINRTYKVGWIDIGNPKCDIMEVINGK